LGLYFSASWCPPCQQFTPILAETYRKLKEKRNDVEFIFISSDRDEMDFHNYYKKMPFLAFPFHLSNENQKLNNLFEVEGIPTLVIVDPTGKTITTDGRSAVMSDREGKDFPWLPKPVNNLDNPTGINENQSLIILAEAEGKQTQEHLESILHAVSEKERAKAQAAGEDLDLLFFIATESSGVSSKVRQLTKLGNPGEGEAKKVVCDGDTCKIVNTAANTQVILLDIPEDGSYFVMEDTPTEEHIHSFLAACRTGSLKRKYFRDA
jgi:nucleoredoxin